MWTIPTALSILREGNTNLDEYPDLMVEVDHHALEVIGGHQYSIYPIAVPFLAAPAVFVIDRGIQLIMNRFPSLQKHARSMIERRRQETTSTMPIPDKIDIMVFRVRVEQLIASLVVALTAVFVYLFSRLAFGHEFASSAAVQDKTQASLATGPSPAPDVKFYSLLIAFTFALCTAAWSTASRGLWQHGPSMLMLSIALYLLVRAQQEHRLTQFSAIPLALAYAFRPTNSISLVLGAIYVLVSCRRYFLPFLGWACLCFAPFLVYNLSLYHSVLQPYFLPTNQGSGVHFFEALAGNLISPGRGLFVFSPVLLLAIWGIVLKVRRKDWHRLESFLLAAVLLHWVVTSYSSKYWWAGHSYGPRLLSDMLPYLTYFLIPTLAWWARRHGKRRAALAAAFSLLFLISLAISFQGAVNWSTQRWNTEPVNVDVNPARVWSWHDLQFLRGIE